MARRLALAVVFAIGCATTSTSKRQLPEGVIDLRCNLGDSRVFLDGKLWPDRCGPDAQQLRIVPGHHRIELRHEGYFAHQQSIDVQHGTPLLLEITLRAVPPLHRGELESESPP